MEVLQSVPFALQHPFAAHAQILSSASVKP